MEPLPSARGIVMTVPWTKMTESWAWLYFILKLYSKYSAAYSRNP